MRTLLTIGFISAAILGFSQPAEPLYTEVEYDPIVRSETKLEQQQSFETKLVKAFKNGDAATISSYFAENVDLSIDGKEDLYSQSQAEQILKTFFITHKAADFKLVHKGQSGQSEYFIGKFLSDLEYRVTINSKKISGVKKITSLTIEES